MLLTPGVEEMIGCERRVAEMEREDKGEEMDCGRSARKCHVWLSVLADGKENECV